MMRLLSFAVLPLVQLALAVVMVFAFHDDYETAAGFLALGILCIPTARMLARLGRFEADWEHHQVITPPSLKMVADIALNFAPLVVLAWGGAFSWWLVAGAGTVFLLSQVAQRPGVPLVLFESLAAYVFAAVWLGQESDSWEVTLPLVVCTTCLLILLTEWHFVKPGKPLRQIPNRANR